MVGRITHEWLISVGIYPNEALPLDYSCRIVGGDDDGWKTSSDQDQDGDEIADLVISFPEDDGEPTDWVHVYIETWQLPDLNTVCLVPLGTRKTQEEILALCRALRAWAIKYPETEAVK